MNLNDAYAQYRSPKNIDRLLAEVRAFALAKAKRRRMQDPQELAQDIAVRVWQTLDRFDPKRGNFRAWVATLTNNYLNTSHRSARRRTQPDQEPEGMTLDELNVSHAKQDTPPRDLNSLPPSVHKIAAMLQLGYSRQEVAEALGCSVQTMTRLIESHQQTLETASAKGLGESMHEMRTT